MQEWTILLEKHERRIALNLADDWKEKVRTYIADTPKASQRDDAESLKRVCLGKGLITANASNRVNEHTILRSKLGGLLGGSVWARSLKMCWTSLGIMSRKN